MKRDRGGDMRIRSGTTTLLAAVVALVVAGCSGTTSGDGPYTGPAGKLFPPDAERVGSDRRPPHVPSETGGAPPPGGTRASGPGPGAAAPVPTLQPPAPAPSFASPPPAAERPRVANVPPPPPTGAQFANAAPAAGEVLEHRIYRPDGEKVGSDLELRIERLWLENGFTFAQLHVRNTSPHELEEITIKCTASGKEHVNLDFREQTLLTRADGRMEPGFQKSMKIRFERGGLDIREMSCTAKGW